MQLHNNTYADPDASALIIHAYAMCLSLSFSTLVHNNPLVLTSCGLACLELVKVPPADGQAALVLVHALAELVDVICARTA
jgi:hypothetical protein